VDGQRARGLPFDGMHPANRFELIRNPDHFILRFGASRKEASAGDFGDEVTTVMLPLTTAMVLGVALFEEFNKATPELQQFFEVLQPRINALNAANKQATKP
jgi:hypothetical protein